MPEIEEWRKVPGWEDYSVSSFGRVRLDVQHYHTKPQLLPIGFTATGYPRVSLFSPGRSRPWPVHILVAAAFLGPKPIGTQVNHKDGDKRNNRPSNLEYVTPAENSAHAARLGLVATGERHGSRTHPEAILSGDRNPARQHPERMARGQRNGNSKLTEEIVRQMRERYGKRRGDSKLAAAEYRITQRNAHEILTRKTWKHVV